MNSNRRVLIFVLSSVGILLLFSIWALYSGFTWKPFQRVNLVADILQVKPDSANLPEDTTAKAPPIIIEAKPAEDFALYQTPRFITSFSTDSTAPSLRSFTQKLHSLQTTKKGKIRIAYFGDSMIEGDLLTQTLRKLLQAEFGGNGVGFVPITSQVSQFRQTVAAVYSEGWKDENFKEGNSRRLYLSGHLFRTTNAWVQMTDHTIHDEGAILEKSLLCGPVAQGTVPVNINNKVVKIKADQPFNRVVLAADAKKSIGLGVGNDQLPVYGISFESESGIFVDNFSFRGITGIELARIDSAFLSASAKSNPYDLIVFQYGVNLLFRPNDKNFGWYAEMILPIIKKLRNCYTGSDFIVVSTADRAFRYSGQYKSAIGIDSLVKIQASLAWETGSSFYNQFASMGGANSIVEWAKAKPSLANQDHVHPNARGAELLATYFFEAIMNDYKKYTHSLK